MRRQICNLISVLYTLAKFSLIKLLHWKRFHFCLIERFSPNVIVEIAKKAKVVFGSKVRVHSGTKIKIRDDAELIIQDNVRINYNCIIACHDRIIIGEGSEFGPSVFLYDHDHDFRAGLEKEKFITSPIIIGKNCWIGANTVILKGSRIGDNSVVGAGTIVSGQYPENSLILQKRQTDVVFYKE